MTPLPKYTGNYLGSRIMTIESGFGDYYAHKGTQLVISLQATGPVMMQNIRNAHVRPCPLTT